MAALDTFLARLLPRAVGCADPVARQAIIDAAIEFCEETQVVQIVTDPIPVAADQAAYALVLPAQTEVVDVRKAWYGTTPLDPSAIEMVSNPLAYGDIGSIDAQTGTPSCYIWHDGEIRVYPVPDANQTQRLTFRVAIKPSTDATELPDELLDNWREGIVHGALERVLGMRGFIHYDVAESMRSAKHFYQAKCRAKAVAATGRGSGDLSVRMRPFA